MLWNNSLDAQGLSNMEIARKLQDEYRNVRLEHFKFLQGAEVNDLFKVTTRLGRPKILAIELCLLTKTYIHIYLCVYCINAGDGVEITGQRFAMCDYH